MIPKLIISDIDGVWTDGGMYYDNHDVEMKKFNTYDSAGVIFCKSLNIPLSIITGEDISIVHRRMAKLGVENYFPGIKNKLNIVENQIEILKIKWEDVAFIGDDLNDIQLLKKVGFSACPSSAPEYIKKIVHCVMVKKGGDGVFREFVEYLLQANNILESTVNSIVENICYKQ